MAVEGWLRGSQNGVSTNNAKLSSYCINLLVAHTEFLPTPQRQIGQIEIIQYTTLCIASAPILFHNSFVFYFFCPKHVEMKTFILSINPPSVVNNINF